MRTTSCAFSVDAHASVVGRAAEMPARTASIDPLDVPPRHPDSPPSYRETAAVTAGFDGALKLAFASQRWNHVPRDEAVGDEQKPSWVAASGSSPPSYADAVLTPEQSETMDDAGSGMHDEGGLPSSSITAGCSSLPLLASVTGAVEGA